VLDACVLYSPSLRDLSLTLAALDAFDVCWSEPILEELSHNVVADNHSWTDSATATQQAVNSSSLRSRRTERRGTPAPQ